MGIILAFASKTAIAQARIEINEKSINRVICHIKFAKVPGLTIVAKRIPESSRVSRVDVERYIACPYNVRLHYRGQSLDIDFSTSVTQNSITNYESGMDTNTGFFSLQDGNWVTNGKLVDVPDNRITVKNYKSSTLIMGTVHRVAFQKRQPDFCFSAALIHRQGMATSFLCAPTRDTVEVFSKLFDKTKVMSAK